MEYEHYEIKNCYRLNDRFVCLVCEGKIIKVRDENIIPRFVSHESEIDKEEKKEKYDKALLFKTLVGPVARILKNNMVEGITGQVEIIGKADHLHNEIFNHLGL